VIKIKNKRFTKAFGENLKRIRTEKKFSQESLSYEADVPLSQIGRIERGEVNTTISTILVLANALDIQPMELLNFKFK
jgi:transcriptional regulator with XRE-family HTH domain